MDGEVGLHRLLARLERHAALEQPDRDALLSLRVDQRRYEPGSYFVREGAPAVRCTLLVNGFAFRQKLTEEGARQIVSIHIPGDFVDFEAAFLKVADHSIQALTVCEVAEIPSWQVLAMIEQHPRLGHALWVHALIDSSIFREWVLNVGRRPARQRIAHILCEMAKRLKLAGLGDETGFRFPMTQEQLADAAGLTPVHVNRCLKSLERDGLIRRERRNLKIPDWERLRDEAGFNELYLHLDQAA